jgi:hypothetical protein
MAVGSTAGDIGITGNEVEKSSSRGVESQESSAQSPPIQDPPRATTKHGGPRILISTPDSGLLTFER